MSVDIGVVFAEGVSRTTFLHSVVRPFRIGLNHSLFDTRPKGHVLLAE